MGTRGARLCGTCCNLDICSLEPGVRWEGREILHMGEIHGLGVMVAVRQERRSFSRLHFVNIVLFGGEVEMHVIEMSRRLQGGCCAPLFTCLHIKVSLDL